MTSAMPALTSLPLPVAPGPSASAVCQAHPLAPLTSPCPRCGRFWCVECAAQGRVCGACKTQQLRALPPLAPRFRRARKALLAQLLFSALMLPVNLYGLTLLGPDGNTPSELTGFDLAALAFSLPLFFCWLATIVFFLRWLHLVVRTAGALGETPEQSPGWAVGWWFVPIYMLFKPYQNVQSLLRKLGGERALESAPVGPWWVLYLLMLFADRAHTRESMRSGTDVSSRAELWTGLVAGVLSLAAGALFLKVLGALQRAAEQRVADAEVQAVLLDQTLPPTPAGHTPIG